MSELIIRKIIESDLENGFLESLDSLRQTSNLEQNSARNILKQILGNENHIIHVAELDGKIVGSTTLLVEQKFIHEGGIVGHIEDVVVKKEFEGQGIGMKLVLSLLDIAKKRECYKTILNCEDELIPFYEKIGFKQKSNEMRFDH
jgi:glucosamine-phosphate N-acetyltransferase